MSQAPFQQAGSLRVGTVDFVSPNEMKVTLDIEALPESVALNRPSPDDRTIGLPKAPRVAGLRSRRSTVSTAEAEPQSARHAASAGARGSLRLQAGRRYAAISRRGCRIADGDSTPIDRRVRRTAPVCLARFLGSTGTS